MNRSNDSERAIGEYAGARCPAVRQQHRLTHGPLSEDFTNDRSMCGENRVAPLVVPARAVGEIHVTLEISHLDERGVGKRNAVIAHILKCETKRDRYPRQRRVRYQLEGQFHFMET